jgi:hypothetical protein
MAGRRTWQTFIARPPALLLIGNIVVAVIMSPSLAKGVLWAILITLVITIIVRIVRAE